MKIRSSDWIGKAWHQCKIDKNQLWVPVEEVREELKKEIENNVSFSNPGGEWDNDILESIDKVIDKVLKGN